MRARFWGLRDQLLARGTDVILEEFKKNKRILYNATAFRACLHLFSDKGFKLVLNINKHKPVDRKGEKA